MAEVEVKKQVRRGRSQRNEGVTEKVAPSASSEAPQKTNPKPETKGQVTKLPNGLVIVSR